MKIKDKNWMIVVDEERAFVRLTSAGIIFGGSDPTLFEYNTARSVSEQIQGIMMLEGIQVKLSLVKKD